MSLIGDVVAASVGMARSFTKERVEATMTCTIRITRGLTPVLGLDGQLTPDPAAAVLYEGRSRLANATGPISYTVGEEVQFFSSGTASIPSYLTIDGVATPIDVAVNDLLYVLSADDALMAGRSFRVVDVETQGLLTGWRRLQIIGVQRYAGWVDAAVRHPVSGEIVPDEVPPEWHV